MNKLACLVSGWVYLAVGGLLSAVPSDYQWILALVLLPLIREILQFIYTGICYYSAQCEDISVTISSKHNIGVRHSIFLAVQMASVATDTTCFVILALDFVLNMILCFKIIRRYKTNENNVDETIMTDALELVLNEKLESVIPILYCLCFLMAHYGPNATILYNISDFDVAKTMTTMALLFSIDFCSCIISTILLWILCGINLFKVYLHSQKELWSIMAAQEAYLIYEVTNLVHTYFKPYTYSLF